MSRLTPAALRSADTDPSAHRMVSCSVVVPFQVMVNGVRSGQPAAMSILARSAGPASTPRMTRLRGGWVSADRRLTSAAWTMRTSPPDSDVSGMPA